MTRLLGVLAGLLLLAGCGSGSSPGDPPASPTAQPDSGFVVSEHLVSRTGGGGTVAGQATPLPDEAAVATLTSGLAARLAAEVRATVAATTVAPGQQVYGQVVSVGCDVPRGVTVDRDPVVVHPETVPSPRSECFAPVTTVAVVVVETG